MLVEEITGAIKKQFPDGIVTVLDPMNDQTHLEAHVISQAFEGKGLLEQHRMVMNPLKGHFASVLHALALKTYTPEQWSQQKGNH